MPYSETARILKSLAVGNTRRRLVVLHPAVWNAPPTSDEDATMALFLIKEYWDARVLGEEGPWAIHPDEILDTNDMEDDGA
ncbi:hypothetical protein C2E23DRAFT_825847 [Lenzites betulinus]|nr:hypothetical protein C2E23DRAFT_825847 [Lenzites betulinus]